MAVTKVLNIDGVKTLWDKIKGMFLPLTGGAVTGDLFVRGNIYKQFANTGAPVFSVSNDAMIVNRPAKFTGNVGVGVAAPNTFDLKVKEKAAIPKLYTERIDMTSSDGIIIGDDTNSGYIKFSTDMEGIDLDGFDSSTMDEPEVGWSLSTSGSMRLNSLTASSSVTSKDITITNALYVKINGTRYKFDAAKAISLGLLVKG